MDHSTRNAPLVVATFLARYLTDKENGAVRTLQEYEELFPGYESVIKREWDQIQQDQPADSHGGVEERSLGKYVIEQELGRGGQGVVYRARDTELRRTVALKVLPAGLARTSEMRQRLFREAEAASRLDDPGICTVYEAGEHEGVAFIAMRLVEGESLAERLSRRRSGGEAPQSEALMLDTTPDPVPVRREPSVRSAPQRPDKDEIVEFVEIIADCAAILHRTHEAGLVHRDIKPGNVMISEDGSPVILDFGLARMEDHPDGSLTEAGDLLGTPAYMSPEQLRDHHRRVDRRTDVYSLAVTLYECLTLRRPFEAPTRERLYMQILDSEPTGASRWNPEIGKDLAVVVACAMDKDRTRRYHTCAEFSEDLRRCLTGSPRQPDDPLPSLGPATPHRRIGDRPRHRGHGVLRAVASGHVAGAAGPFPACRRPATGHAGQGPFADRYRRGHRGGGGRGQDASFAPDVVVLLRGPGLRRPAHRPSHHRRPRSLQARPRRHQGAGHGLQRPSDRGLERQDTETDPLRSTRPAPLGTAAGSVLVAYGCGGAQ